MKRGQEESNLLHRMLRPVAGGVVWSAGVVALVLWLFALTPLPWKVFGWMGAAGPDRDAAPAYIVLMGGGGIPSESGLMRCYETAVQAARHPKAKVVVAMPLEPDEKPGGTTVVMRELMLRGVDRARILHEDKGRHSAEQARFTWKLVDGARAQPAVMIVSSPEHVLRSRLAFRKAGFTKVRGAGTFGEMLHADLSMPSETIASLPVPDPGRSILLRYRVWDTLIIEVRVLRELAALGYYKLKGWI